MKTPQELAEELYPMEQGNFQMNSYQSEKRNAFIAGYETAEPKWISVEDEIPEWQVKVVILRKSGMPLIGYRQRFDYFGREVNDWNHKNVTHWMPLPSPTKTIEK